MIYINEVEEIYKVILELEDIIEMNIDQYRKEIDTLYDSIERCVKRLSTKPEVAQLEEELFVIIYPKQMDKEEDSESWKGPKYLLQVNRAMNYLKYKPQ